MSRAYLEKVGIAPAFAAEPFSDMLINYNTI